MGPEQECAAMPIPVPSYEPHKIKTVRLVSFPTLEERKRHLAAAHFNTFNLTPAQVNFDLTSYGTSAVTQEQLAGQLVGDEAYAGARNFENLERAVNRVLGHTYVCPTHNLLGCLKLVVATMVPAGATVASNSQWLADVLAPRSIAAADVRTQDDSVFTGNVDLERLRGALATGAVALVDLQAFADGMHPFSLANLKAVRTLADQRGVRLVLDGSRLIENAWYIQRHEPGMSDRPVADLVKQMV
jgi:tyrosine phenol-lyase